MLARYGQRFVECPDCGNAVPKGAGSCPACGHRFHYWYVAAVGFVVLLAIAAAVYVIYAYGGHP